MLGDRTRTLLSTASDALAPPLGSTGGPDGILTQITELLRERNGFYAFESALHVFPGGAEAAPGRSLREWNAESGWRAEYQDLASGLVFFAEDIFGVQFAVRDPAPDNTAPGNTVVTFDPETGESEPIADGVEQWADVVLKDYEVMTGFPLAHRWQEANGPLPPGKRLVPKIPFVLGGEFDVANLYALDADQGMRVRAELARQLRDLPDGAKITYRVT